MRQRSLPQKIFLVLFISLLSFLFQEVKAQYFSIGVNPASVRWEQVNTPHFQLITPRSFAKNVNYLANAMEYIYGPGSASLHSHPVRIPLLLHNLSTNSNAFVPYAPRRMEFITVPEQNTYAQNWMDQLVLHEFRHVAQYAVINQGFTHGLTWFFGQQAVPAMIALFVPLWFIEGDAVGTETSLSMSGRGRSPSFYQHLRAQFLDKKIYHYDKAVNGSFRDFIPDRYELGYQLVGLTRVKYGKDVWANVLKNVGRRPFTFVPFSHSLKKQTGLGKYKLYDSLTTQIRGQWRERDRRTALTPFRVMSPVDSVNYTNYTLASRLPEGNILAVKSSINDITKVVEISPDKKEKTLFLTGVSFPEESISSGGNLICWSERLLDPRWSLREYSVIYTYDLLSGKKKQLTRKSRYFSPAISPDGSRIATVKVSLDNQYSLLILDASNGEIQQSIKTSENLYFIQPTWTSDGKNILSVVLGNYGKSIVWVNLPDSSTRFLIPFTSSDISRPFDFGHYILYTGPYSGVENIFALDTLTNKTYRVISSRFGATDGSIAPHSKNLLYSNYTADGYQVAETDLDPATWTGPVLTGNFSTPLADSLAAMENFLYRSKDVPTEIYDTVKYRKALNLFDFHSWAPLSFNLNNMTIKPGVMLMSQNLLSSSYTTLGWEYDLNEETGKYYLDYSYEGLYPTIGLHADYGLRRSVYLGKDSLLIPYKWNELNLQLNLGVPLNWYSGPWYLGVQPTIGSTYKYLKIVKGSELRFNHDRIQSMDYDLYAYTQYKKSLRDLYPKWGQQIELTYHHTPFDGYDNNSIFSTNLVLYFPGIIPHQGLKLYAGYQDRKAAYYDFGNQINMPRGYTGLFPGRAYSFSGTYAFPIAYPDWHAGNFLYLKRIKGAVFYDHLIDTSTPSAITYNSIGLDISVDLHILSFLAPFQIGLRTIYNIQEQRIETALLFNIDYNSLY